MNSHRYLSLFDELFIKFHISGTLRL